MAPPFLSVRELMKLMKTDECLSVLKAIESGLPAYEKGDWVKDFFPDWGKPKEKKWRPSPLGKKTRQIKMDELDSVEFENITFLYEDVERFGIKDGDTGSGGKALSCEAIIDEPVFQESMRAIKTMLEYCEKNAPAIKTEAQEHFHKKHKGLSKWVFQEIWFAIPHHVGDTQLRLKQGQKRKDIAKK